MMEARTCQYGDGFVEMMAGKTGKRAGHLGLTQRALP